MSHVNQQHPHPIHTLKSREQALGKIILQSNEPLQEARLLNSQLY